MNTSATGDVEAGRVEVGRILGAWGVRGALRVRPHARDGTALLRATRWHLHRADPGPAAPVPPTSLVVRRPRRQGEDIVALAEGVADRDAAEVLAGCVISVDRDTFEPPAPGEHYWIDLIGLRVEDRSGRTLGTVSGLVETGPHCVLEIAAEGRRLPLLVPFVEAYVDAVEPEQGRVRVDWPFDDD